MARYLRLLAEALGMPLTYAICEARRCYSMKPVESRDAMSAS